MHPNKPTGTPYYWWCVLLLKFRQILSVLKTWIQVSKRWPNFLNPEVRESCHWVTHSVFIFLKIISNSYCCREKHISVICMKLVNLRAWKTTARKRNPTSFEIIFCFLVHGNYLESGRRTLVQKEPQLPDERADLVSYQTAKPWGLWSLMGSSEGWATQWLAESFVCS